MPSETQALEVNENNKPLSSMGSMFSEEQQQQKIDVSVHRTVFHLAWVHLTLDLVFF